jgi:hypothetical protein
MDDYNALPDTIICEECGHTLAQHEPVMRVKIIPGGFTRDAFSGCKAQQERDPWHEPCHCGVFVYFDNQKDESQL